MKNRKFIKYIATIALASILVLFSRQQVEASDTYTLEREMKVYLNATDAANKTNAVKTYAAGEYYIYKIHNGMYNISKTKGEAGAWINPDSDVKEPEIKVPTIRIEGNVRKYTSFPVYHDLQGFSTSDDAYKSNSPKATLKAGNYYVVEVSNNMLKLSSDRNESGYWVNPALNDPAKKVRSRANPYAFIERIAETATSVTKDNDLYTSVMIAQAALESGWGVSDLSVEPYNNLFGVKGNYEGESVLMKTFEYDRNNNRYNVLASFKKYPSVRESLLDYLFVLTGNEVGSWRHNFYLGARVSQTNSYEDATLHLTGRYATSPVYNVSLNRIIETYDLTKYDWPVNRVSLPDPVKSYEVLQSSNTNGVLNGWHLITNQGEKYFINSVPVTGMAKIGNTTYLFDSKGVKQYGWHRLNDYDYYFSPDHNGGMLTGKRKIGNTTYLFTSSGNKSFGWHNLNGKAHYFSPRYSGGMITGPRRFDNTIYLFNGAGEKQTGWHLVNGISYYFNPNANGGATRIKRGNTVLKFSDVLSSMTNETR